MNTGDDRNETLDTRVLLGKILGEVYRIQRRSPDAIPCAASDSRVYGLLNGVERAIDDELRLIGFISEEKLQAVEEILFEYFSDEEKLSSLTGFYDIEPRLTGRGVSRGDAMQIFRYLLADGRFVEVIAKMDSANSPMECRTFELSEWDS